MHKRMGQLLLLLAVIALLAAPLRGAIALSMPATADGESRHCAHMSPGMGQASDRHADAGRQADGGCDHGCGGKCCNGKCGGCVHATVALPGVIDAAVKRYSHACPKPMSDRFTGTTAHPPFRPPILRT